MDKKTGIIIGVIVAAFAVLIGATMFLNREEKVDYSKYNFEEVIPADEFSGNLPEMVVGNPDAPVKIFEYADYQCEGCAAMNPQINALLAEYDSDQVALVFRNTVLSYHQNGTAAASAAQAAALQGYWKEFKDLMYANQNEWYYSGANDRQEQFEEYFQKASGGKGDLVKFREDMNSKEVAKKVSFDSGLYDYQTENDGMEEAWTPMFYVDGELIDQYHNREMNIIDEMRKKIDAKLEELGLEKKKS